MDGLWLETFRAVKRIEMGGCGVVEEGVGPNGEPVAIKFELALEKVTRPILEHEYRVYQILSGRECIPNVIAYGRQQRFNVMVMDLLGPSLGNCFRRCASRLSLRTTACLALGMLDAIEYIHSRGFIHRDVKPDNFLLGRGTKSHVVHLVDFGLARPWRNSTTGTHSSSSPIEEEGPLGTLYFASVNAHLGQAQTRRDDLQALAYAVLLFARGNLPWDRIRGATSKHCRRRILEKKRSWNATRLCQDLPHELEEFVGHCFDLETNEEPRYDLLRHKLAVVAEREGWNADSKFEWEEPGWSASFAHNPPAPPLELVLPPGIKRGDVVLLKIIPEKSLDFEHPPRMLDQSFFPHQSLSGVEWHFPFRPAVVYPLTRRSDLRGLSTRRSRCFLSLEMLLEAATGVQVPCDDIFVYRTKRGTFKVEYDQATTTTSRLSVPECILAAIENKFADVDIPYARVYESDDEETRTILGRLPKTWSPYSCVMEVQTCDASDVSGGISAADFSGINGWTSELIRVEQVRREEDGESWNDDSDDDSEIGWNFYDWPRAANRRLSCTIRTSDVDYGR